MGTLKYLIILGSCTFVYLIIGMLAEQKRGTPVFHVPWTVRPDSTLYEQAAERSNVLHSSTRGSFNRLSSSSLKFVSTDIKTYDNDSLCSPVNISWSVKTLFEFDDIYILPQHRLKFQRTNLTPAVCFYRDSFVPIYADHISVLQTARQYIDHLGTHELLAAYISPSHSGDVADKLNPKEMIGVGHRLSMINLAIKNLDWVMVDLFETFQPCNTKSSVIMKAFISRLHSQLLDRRRIDVFWLTGEDLFTYSGPPDEIIRLGFQPMYVINQESNRSVLDKNNQFKSDQDYYEKQWHDMRTLSSFPERFHLIHAKHITLSSNHIRTCARKPSVTRHHLQRCTHLDNITTYILQHHLWDTSVDALPILPPALSAFSTNISNATSELLSHMISVYSNTSAEIISFKFKQIGIGKGYNSRVYSFYSIQYSPDSMSYLPQNMVLKILNSHWIRIFGSTEAEFYTNFGPRISSIETPKYFYIGRRAHSHNESLLLFEDVSVNYDPLELIGRLEHSKLFSVLASIASLHAEFFKHPLLQQKTFAWLPLINSSAKHYYDGYASFIADKNRTQLLKSKVSNKAYAYAQELVTHIPHLFQKLTDQHYTLSHGDLWSNNIFRRRDQPHKILLLDWERCCRANGLIDVAHFLRFDHTGRGRSFEPQALELYHQILIKYGVSQYEASEIREDYYSLALPFLFIKFASWKIDVVYMHMMVMILEDIVTYGNEPQQTTVAIN